VSNRIVSVLSVNSDPVLPVSHEVSTPQIPAEISENDNPRQTQQQAQQLYSPRRKSESSLASSEAGNGAFQNGNVSLQIFDHKTSTENIATKVAPLPTGDLLSGDIETPNPTTAVGGTVSTIEAKQRILSSEEMKAAARRRSRVGIRMVPIRGPGLYRESIDSDIDLQNLYLSDLRRILHIGGKQGDGTNGSDSDDDYEDEDDDTFGQGDEEKLPDDVKGQGHGSDETRGALDDEQIIVRGGTPSLDFGRTASAASLDSTSSMGSGLQDQQSMEHSTTTQGTKSRPVSASLAVDDSNAQSTNELKLDVGSVDAPRKIETPELTSPLRGAAQDVDKAAAEAAAAAAVAKKKKRKYAKWSKVKARAAELMGSHSLAPSEYFPHIPWHVAMNPRMLQQQLLILSERQQQQQRQVQLEQDSSSQTRSGVTESVDVQNGKSTDNSAQSSSTSSNDSGSLKTKDNEGREVPSESQTDPTKAGSAKSQSQDDDKGAPFGIPTPPRHAFPIGLSLRVEGQIGAHGAGLRSDETDTFGWIKSDGTLDKGGKNLSMAAAAELGGFEGFWKGGGAYNHIDVQRAIALNRLLSQTAAWTDEFTHHLLQRRERRRGHLADQIEGLESTTERIAVRLEAEATSLDAIASLLVPSVRARAKRLRQTTLLKQDNARMQVLDEQRELLLDELWKSRQRQAQASMAEHRTTAALFAHYGALVSRQVDQLVSSMAHRRFALDMTADEEPTPFLQDLADITSQTRRVAELAADAVAKASPVVATPKNLAQPVSATASPAMTPGSIGRNGSSESSTPSAADTSATTKLVAHQLSRPTMTSLKRARRLYELSAAKLTGAFGKQSKLSVESQIGAIVHDLPQSFTQADRLLLQSLHLHATRNGNSSGSPGEFDVMVRRRLLDGELIPPARRFVSASALKLEVSRLRFDPYLASVLLHVPLHGHTITHIAPPMELPMWGYVFANFAPRILKKQANYTLQDVTQDVIFTTRISQDTSGKFVGSELSNLLEMGAEESDSDNEAENLPEAVDAKGKEEDGASLPKLNRPSSLSRSRVFSPREGHRRIASGGYNNTTSEAPELAHASFGLKGASELADALITTYPTPLVSYTNAGVPVKTATPVLDSKSPNHVQASRLAKVMKRPLHADLWWTEASSVPTAEDIARRTLLRICGTATGPALAQRTIAARSALLVSSSVTSNHASALPLEEDVVDDDVTVPGSRPGASMANDPSNNMNASVLIPTEWISDRLDKTFTVAQVLDLIELFLSNVRITAEHKAETLEQHYRERYMEEYRAYERQLALYEEYQANSKQAQTNRNTAKHAAESTPRVNPPQPPNPPSPDAFKQSIINVLHKHLKLIGRAAAGLPISIRLRRVLRRLKRARFLVAAEALETVATAVKAEEEAAKRRDSMEAPPQRPLVVSQTEQHSYGLGSRSRGSISESNSLSSSRSRFDPFSMNPSNRGLSSASESNTHSSIALHAQAVLAARILLGDQKQLLSNWSKFYYEVNVHSPNDIWMVGFAKAPIHESPPFSFTSTALCKGMAICSDGSLVFNGHYLPLVLGSFNSASRRTGSVVPDPTPGSNPLPDPSSSKSRLHTGLHPVVAARLQRKRAAAELRRRRRKQEKSRTKHSYESSSVELNDSKGRRPHLRIQTEESAQVEDAEDVESASSGDEYYLDDPDLDVESDDDSYEEEAELTDDQNDLGEGDGPNVGDPDRPYSALGNYSPNSEARSEKTNAILQRQRRRIRMLRRSLKLDSSGLQTVYSERYNEIPQLNTAQVIGLMIDVHEGVIYLSVDGAIPLYPIFGARVPLWSASQQEVQSKLIKSQSLTPTIALLGRGLPQFSSTPETTYSSLSGGPRSPTNASSASQQQAMARAAKHHVTTSASLFRNPFLECPASPLVYTTAGAELLMSLFGEGSMKSLDNKSGPINDGQTSRLGMSTVTTSLEPRGGLSDVATFAQALKNTLFYAKRENRADTARGLSSEVTFVTPTGVTAQDDSTTLNLTPHSFRTLARNVDFIGNLSMDGIRRFIEQVAGLNKPSQQNGIVVPVVKFGSTLRMPATTARLLGALAIEWLADHNGGKFGSKSPVNSSSDSRLGTRARGQGEVSSMTPSSPSTSQSRKEYTLSDLDSTMRQVKGQLVGSENDATERNRWRKAALLREAEEIKAKRDELRAMALAASTGASGASTGATSLSPVQQSPSPDGAEGSPSSTNASISSPNESPAPSELVTRPRVTAMSPTPRPIEQAAKYIAGKSDELPTVPDGLSGATTTDFWSAANGPALSVNFGAFPFVQFPPRYLRVCAADAASQPPGSQSEARLRSLAASFNASAVPALRKELEVTETIAKNEAAAMNARLATTRAPTTLTKIARMNPSESSANSSASLSSSSQGGMKFANIVKDLMLQNRDPKSQFEAAMRAPKLRSWSHYPPQAMKLTQSVLVVQRAFRRFLANTRRKAYMRKRLMATLVLQKHIRAWLNRRKQKQIQAAVKIQALWRGYRARRFLAVLKHHNISAANASVMATRIQAAFRGYLARKLAKSKAIMQKERAEYVSNLVRFIQIAWRSNARGGQGIIRTRAQLVAALEFMRLHSFVRLRNLLAQHDRNVAELEERARQAAQERRARFFAVLRIQAWFRKHRQRMALRDLRERTKAAAITIRRAVHRHVLLQRLSKSLPPAQAHVLACVLMSLGLYPNPFEEGSLAHDASVPIEEPDVSDSGSEVDSYD